MEIKGFIGVSLSDWDGKVSSVLFLPGCNLRCPFCYNKGLVLHPQEMLDVSNELIENYLRTNREWIDGVVVTGGEPTVHTDLPLLCERIKKMGFGVKIDTNGTNPAMLRELIKEQLVDYVALDVKAPFSKEEYARNCGVDAADFLKKIQETVQLLQQGSFDYEFRTTVVPTLHEAKDIERIRLGIRECKKYVLQNFKSDVETINPKFQDLVPFSKMDMESFVQSARKIVSNTVVRG